MSPFSSLTIDIPKINFRNCGIPLQRMGTLDSFGTDAPFVVHEKWVYKLVEQLCVAPELHRLYMLLALSGYVIESIVFLQDQSSLSDVDAYLYALNPGTMHYTGERLRTTEELDTRWFELTTLNRSSLPGAKTIIGLHLNERACQLPGDQISYAVPLPDFATAGSDFLTSAFLTGGWLTFWTTSSTLLVDGAINVLRTALADTEIALLYELQVAFNNNQPSDTGEPKIRTGLLHNFTPYNCWNLTPPDDFETTVTWGNPMYSQGVRSFSHLGVWNYVYRIWMGLLENALVDVESLYSDDLNAIVRKMVPANSSNKDLEAAKLSEYIGFLYKSMSSQLLQTGVSASQFQVTARQLGKLPWAEILFMLHNLHLTDMLSGVDVRTIIPADGSAPDNNPILPLVSYDATGFYDEFEGDGTLQINQAGDFWRGHYQRRYNDIVRGIAHYTFDAYGVSPSNGSGNIIATANITLTRVDPGITGLPFDETGSDSEPAQLTAELRLEVGQPLPNSSTSLQIAVLKFSENDEQRFFQWTSEPFWADAIIDNLEDVIRDLHGSRQRAPLHFSERSPLDQLMNDLIDFSYRPYNPWHVTDQDREYEENLTANFLTIMQPYGYYAPPAANDGTGTLHGDQPQLPEVRHHITYGIQTTNRPNADRVPWEAFLLALNARRSVEPTDPHNPYTIYRVVMTYLGIDEEDLDAILTDIENPNFIYEWYTEGIQIGTPTMNPFVGAVSHAFNFVVKQIYPEPPPNDARWPALLQGKTYGGSFGVSPTKISGSGVVYKSTPSELGAQVAWGPENFEGKVWLYGADITVTPGVGGSASKGRIVIYGNRSNVRALSGASDGWAVMAGVAIGAGTSSTIGTMDFRPEGQADTPIPLIQYEDITRWQEGTPQHFTVGKSTLTAEGWNVLKRMVAEYRVGLQGWHSYIELSGFASPTYTSEFNMTLSQNRAQSVFNAMYQLLGGVMQTPSHQITIRGYGMEPALLVGSVAHGQENDEWRRVDIRLNGVLVAQVQGN